MYINKARYKELIKEKKDFKIIITNALEAFFFGGLICEVGQLFILLYENGLKMDTKDSQTMMLITMIFIASILSAFGIYDKIGQLAKCGSILPITGFANSCVSSAMEYHSEGFFLGISSNVFKLAGAVISLGVFFATIVSIIYYLVNLL